MSAHGPMPRSAWIFPALAGALFSVATGLGLSFTPSPGGLVVAVAVLSVLFGTGAGADLFGGPTRLRQHRHRHSLWGVSLYPDHPAPRLFHQRCRRRRR